MDNINREISKIVEKTGSKRITVLTNALKIDGFVYTCSDNKCKQVIRGVLTLQDAVVCKLSDYCTCDEEECKCNDFVCFKYKWLNIMQDKIVSFSILD
jgi:hypothetical protein